MGFFEKLFGSSEAKKEKEQYDFAQYLTGEELKKKAKQEKKERKQADPRELKRLMKETKREQKITEQAERNEAKASVTPEEKKAIGAKKGLWENLKYAIKNVLEIDDLENTMGNLPEETKGYSLKEVAEKVPGLRSKLQQVYGKDYKYIFEFENLLEGEDNEYNPEEFKKTPGAFEENLEAYFFRTGEYEKVANEHLSNYAADLGRIFRKMSPDFDLSDEEIKKKIMSDKGIQQDLEAIWSEKKAEKDAVRFGLKFQKEKAAAKKADEQAA